jgi:transposase-like protein
MARRAESGARVAEVAGDFYVSEQTVRKWLRRWQAEGGLHDRSSKSGRSRGTAAQEIAAVEELRRQRMTSPAIARRLTMATSTVTKILRRLGLNRLKAIDPPPARRYQRERPGELLHLDTKKLGRIGSVSHRITGRHSGVINRHRGTGWDYLHVCVDDTSRLAYSEILPHEHKESAVAFLRRALAWFASRVSP